MNNKNDDLIEQLMRRGMTYEDLVHAVDKAKTALEEEMKAEATKHIEEEAARKTRIKKAANNAARAILELEVAYGNMKASDVTDEYVQHIADLCVKTFDETVLLEDSFSNYSDFLNKFF